MRCSYHRREYVAAQGNEKTFLVAWVKPRPQQGQWYDLLAMS